MLRNPAAPCKTESRKAMPARKSDLIASRLKGLTLAAVVLGAAAVLTGCGANRDGMTTGAIPDDYRTRHPITVTEVEHTLDIPISSGDRKLTIGMKDTIAGFASDYLASSSGTMQIMVPQGSMNAGAASMLRKEIRATLAGRGVPSPRIIETSYQAAATGDAAPVRLSYVATTAVTDQCGQWPEDLSDNTIMNRNWHNFGCATQSNLAAQVASPMDLIAPRGVAPIDAARRSKVIGLYRAGNDTATK